MRPCHSTLVYFVCLPVLAVPWYAAAADVDPAYQIVLRSRHSQVLPTKDRQAQTGGGSIIVEQPEPNTIIVTMAGSAVAGSSHCASHADMTFELIQELDIIPRRDNARSPLVGLVGRVMGTVQVSDPVACCVASGTAQQGPATACLSFGGMDILSLDVKPSSVACGQKLAINHQSGPIETPIETSTSGSGCYRLSATFQLSADQQVGVFHRHYSVADFDPFPQLDAFWADALKPFRAVPRSQFGYTLVLRVVEDNTTPDGLASFSMAGN